MASTEAHKILQDSSANLRQSNPGQGQLKVAILDDYIDRAKSLADWDSIAAGVDVTTFKKPLSKSDAIGALSDFDVLSLMRERMVLDRELLKALPRLKLIVVTGSRFRCVDMDAASELGIEVRPSGGLNTQAPAEFALALLLAAARQIPLENASVRSGGWQTALGMSLQNCTVGVLGLGRFGQQFAQFVRPLCTRVIAWSPNLSSERAAAAGVDYANKATFFKEADAISIHMVLSDSTKGLVGAKELSQMRAGSILVNTSRGPIIDEAALLEALKNGPLGMAALDVYETEPLPREHPFRTLKNVVAMPHIGYATETTFREYYTGTVAEIRSWHLAITGN